MEGLSHRIEHTLRRPAEDRRKAMAAMAEHIRTYDVHHWVTGQLAEIAARGKTPNPTAPPGGLAHDRGS